MKRIAAVVATLLLAAGSAAAQQAMKPAAEMEQIKSFAGSWTCSGNAPASSFGPAHKTQAVVQSKRDLDGHWIVGSVKGTRTAEDPHPIHGMFHMGYDPAAKSYAMFWLDNTGSWAHSTSPGWQGNTMVFTGDQLVMGQKAKVRDTFVKKTEADWQHRVEMNIKGNWELIVDESCKKKM
jgi:hypothetical protein